MSVCYPSRLYGSFMLIIHDYCYCSLNHEIHLYLNACKVNIVIILLKLFFVIIKNIIENA